MKNLNRFLSFALALIMLTALNMTAFAAANDTGFTDVPADAWYAGAVEYAVEHELMAGVGDGRFDPDGETSRAMLVTILWRMAGRPVVNYLMQFPDVSTGEWYTEAVRWAASERIVAGYDNGNFGTNDPVSREQIVTILWRYKGSPASEVGQDFVDEADISDYAAQAVDWSRNNGVVGGKGGNRFDPKGHATRAETATIMRNFLALEQTSTSSTASKTLVAYYSATGSTQRVANYIAEELNADTFELVPVDDYTSADLNWTDSGSRVNAEHNDESKRKIELVSATPENWADYDVVFVGYPIWWGIAAWPVNGFIQNNDFTGKTVIPFCTSSSSGLGQSGELLAEMARTGNWQTGQRFSSGVSQSAVTDWVNGLELPSPGDPSGRPSDVSNIRSVENVPLLTLNNGVQIPQLGLGTQIQRLEGDRSESGRALLNATSREAVAAALRSGYRHLDTAHGYYNEVGVGQGIKDSGVPREEIWVTSKLWPSEYGEGVTMQAIDAMLERLQLDYLDCIYLHHPAGDYLGAWKDLEEAYRQGKVRALGISNFDNWPEAFNAIMENSTIKPQILQIECHPFAQRQETRVLAERYGLQVECWYPLGHADDRLLNNDVLSQIAQAHNKSVVQIILRWHIQEGFSVIPGSTNPDHIQENIEIFDFELSDSEMAQIRAMDRGEEGRYFNLNYEFMGGFFTNPID